MTWFATGTRHGLSCLGHVTQTTFLMFVIPSPPPRSNYARSTAVENCFGQPSPKNNTPREHPEPCFFLSVHRKTDEESARSLMRTVSPFLL